MSDVADLVADAPAPVSEAPEPRYCVSCKHAKQAVSSVWYCLSRQIPVSLVTGQWESRVCLAMRGSDYCGLEAKWWEARS